MATIHIPEAEAADRFASLMASVRTGDEVIIESDSRHIAVLRAAPTKSRTLAKCIAMLPDDSDAIMDEDFARDVQAASDTHREPLDPSE